MLHRRKLFFLVAAEEDVSHKIDKNPPARSDRRQFYYRKSKAIATHLVIVDCVDIHLSINGTPVNE
jgi:hypothetical protein